jgi:flagellum-specific ATP synthase
MVSITDDPHQKSARKVRDLLATWSENEELIRLGAYRKGSSPEVDEAIAKHPDLEFFLKQDVEEATGFIETKERLAQFEKAVKPPPEADKTAPAIGKKLGIRAGGFYGG